VTFQFPPSKQAFSLLPSTCNRLGGFYSEFLLKSLFIWLLCSCIYILIDKRIFLLLFIILILLKMKESVGKWW
jgi:hypothetical protein